MLWKKGGGRRRGGGEGGILKAKISTSTSKREHFLLFEIRNYWTSISFVVKKKKKKSYGNISFLTSCSNIVEQQSQTTLFPRVTSLSKFIIYQTLTSSVENISTRHSQTSSNIVKRSQTTISPRLFRTTSIPRSRKTYLSRRKRNEFDPTERRHITETEDRSYRDPMGC